MTQDTEDVVALVQGWINRGCSSWGIPAHEIAQLLADRQSLSDRIDVDLHGAFMAGWLTRHSSDAQPEDAWAIYRAALHQEGSATDDGR